MAPARKRLPADERRKQILKSAVKTFSRSNYRAAKTADIATAAGISEALIYRFFPSKKAIFLEILQHISQRILILWQEEVAKEEDATRALRNMGMRYFERIQKHPEELRVQFQAISEVSDPAIAKQLRRDHEQYMRFIEKVLEKGVRQGTVRRDLPVKTLAVLFDGMGILMNMMRLLAFDRRFDHAKAGALMDHLLDSIKA
jgi:TetR/AcrR family transcriptional regulator